MKIYPFGSATHPGRVRNRNEDSFGIDQAHRTWLIADGLGGHEAGDIASQIVVETVLDEIKIGTDLVRAINQAHAALITAAHAGAGHPEMGTTVVTLKINDTDYEVAWVGDSRAYLWNGQELVQITKDHTVVQELVDQGFLPADRLRNHPYANILNRTLGVVPDKYVGVDRISGTLTGKEQFLLCSDGLTNEVETHEIHAVLSQEGSEQWKVERLIEMALANGGSDNVTAILVNTTIQSQVEAV